MHAREERPGLNHSGRVPRPTAGPGPHAELLELHKAVGNQAFTRLVEYRDTGGGQPGAGGLGQEAMSRPDRQPLSTIPRAGNTTVQRMFKRVKAAVTSPGPSPAEQTVRVDHEDLTVTRTGAFYTHKTDHGATVYIHAAQVEKGVLNADLVPYVLKYLAGGLALYRGIPRWHATWHEVTGNGVIKPLGTGEKPDFHTHNTSFIPFSPDEVVARSAAVATKGMGKRDRIEYVDGYSKNNGNFPVGLLATAVAGPHQDVAFFNATEIQLRGPVHASDKKIFDMSTDGFEALTGTAGPEPEALRESRPDTPNEAQKQAFAQEHGGLLS